MTTISEACKDGPVICLMGAARPYAIGDTAYRFSRPEGTLPMFARGWPMTFMNGEFRARNVPCLIVPWDREVTVLEAAPAAAV